MLEYTRPTSLRELRGFLGLTSYYRKFIQGYAHITAPLTDLLKGPKANKSSRRLKAESLATWEEGIWTDIHDQAFETLKGALLSRPVLTLPNPKHRWRLATDASDVAMGAVLSQIDTEGQEHPVGYYSRKLNEAE